MPKSNQTHTPAVICKGIYKHYGEGEARVEALKGVDLEVKKGELRLLMGPSGSGKTTLISIISGILTQDRGECLVNGVDLNHLSEKERTLYRGKNIGFAFQTFNLVPMLTNEENISVPLLFQGVPRKIALEKSKELLKELGITDKIGAYPNELSGGQQQRIAIGRAIVHDPLILVCDEPTSFLDLHTGQKIMELLRAMVEERGLTLIVVTHDPRITKYADKIDYLEDGKIIEG